MLLFVEQHLINLKQAIQSINLNSKDKVINKYSSSQQTGPLKPDLQLLRTMKTLNINKLGQQQSTNLRKECNYQHINPPHQKPTPGIPVVEGVTSIGS
jgi:hypothetical protein